jgi:predicted SprT family Zn-dependent metalloprotease
MTDTPTEAVYKDLLYAYDYFNDVLFGGKLPTCLITMQRKPRARGYFSYERFNSRRDEQDTTDEIALNPVAFQDRTDEEILSTLVHEMVHLWQYHVGSPSRSGYHNREWADMMKRLGLPPSDTGKPGGRETGQRVTHYIIPGGPFALTCAVLLEDGDCNIHYEEKGSQNAAKKAASKTRYTCPSCGLNAWAKPGVRINCDQCDKPLIV